MRNEKHFIYSRWASLAGSAGAFLFFCGDMLYYGHWGSGADFHNNMLLVVRSASLTRLFVGGLIGPVAACLCLIGFWQVRERITPRSPVLGWLTFLSGGAMMLAGSALHALWMPRGLAYRYAEQASPVELVAALRDYWQAAYYVAAVPAYICSLLLLVAVLLGRSLYPRWTVLANFGLLSLLSPLAQRVPAPLGGILVGGFTNLCIATFFLVSALSTWWR